MNYLIDKNYMAMRSAVVGIGQELRGDDALGIEIARRLKPLAEGRPDWLVIEAGPAPENFTGPLRRFAPQRIFLVDAALMDEQPGAIRQIDWRFAASPSSVPGYSAALMNEEPGAVRQLDWREADSASSAAGFGAAGFGAATHGLPLATFASYLAAELSCEVILIGVQPGGNTLDAPLTPQVQSAVDEVVERFGVNGG